MNIKKAKKILNSLRINEEQLSEIELEEEVVAKAYVHCAALLLERRLLNIQLETTQVKS